MISDRGSVRGQCRAHPLHGRWIAVHKNNFARRQSFGVIDERLARGVCAELKLFDLAADALGRLVGVKGNLPICSRVP